MPCSDVQMSAAKAFPPSNENVALATAALAAAAALKTVCMNAFDCLSFTVPGACCHLHCHSPPSFPPEVLISTYKSVHFALETL